MYILIQGETEGGDFFRVYSDPMRERIEKEIVDRKKVYIDPMGERKNIQIQLLNRERGSIKRNRKNIVTGIGNKLSNNGSKNIGVLLNKFLKSVSFFITCLD